MYRDAGTMSVTTNESTSTLSESFESSDLTYTVTTSSDTSAQNTSTTNTNSSPTSQMSQKNSTAIFAEAGYPAPKNSHPISESVRSKGSFLHTFSDVESFCRSSDCTDINLGSELSREEVSPELRESVQKLPSESGSQVTASTDISVSSYRPDIILTNLFGPVVNYVASSVWGSTPQSDEGPNHHIPHQPNHQMQFEKRQEETTMGAFYLEDDQQSIGTVPTIPPSSPPPISRSSLELNMNGLSLNPHAWDPQEVLRFFENNEDWLMNLILKPSNQEVFERLLNLSISGEEFLDPDIFDENFLKEDLKIVQPIGRKRLMKLVRKLRDTFPRPVIRARVSGGHIAQGNIGISIQQGNGNINNVNNIGSLFMDNSKQINHHYSGTTSQINHHYGDDQGPQLISTRYSSATFYKGVEYVCSNGRFEAICKVKGKRYRIPNCQGRNEKEVAKRLRKENKRLIQEGHELDKCNGFLCFRMDSEPKLFRAGWKDFKKAMLEIGHILPKPRVITLCNRNSYEMSSDISGEVEFSSPDRDTTEPFCALNPVSWLKFSTLMAIATNTTTRVQSNNLHFELKDFDSLKKIVDKVPYLNELQGLSKEELREFSIEDYATMRSNLDACPGKFFSTWQFDSKQWRLVHSQI